MSADDLNQHLRDQGFAVVRLIDDGAVRDLRHAFHALDIDPPAGGFHATMHLDDADRKHAISEDLKGVLGPAIGRILPDHAPLFANFIVKYPHNTHQVGIHRDWTYVDEARHRSVNVWTALADTDQRNGCLWAVAGSHRDAGLRATPFDVDEFAGREETIHAASVAVPLRAGEALVYDSALIHYSLRNETDAPRPAVGCVCIPEGAMPVHWFREPDGRLVRYDAPSAFFSRIVPGDRPDDAFLASHQCTT